VENGIDSLSAVVDDLRDANVAVSDIGLRRPTLDDVFLTLTGHHVENTSDGSSDDATADATTDDGITV
jgi:ABC-2 type transport system ATP-binding protein